MGLINNILGRPNRDQKTLIFTIVIACLALYVTFYFIFLPALKKDTALSRQIKEKKISLSGAQMPAAEYSLLEDKVKNIQEELQILKNKIFWEKDISRFLNTVTQLAADLQIEFVSLKPEKLQPGALPVDAKKKDKKGKKDNKDKQVALLRPVPITIILRSSYADLIKFLERIEESEKLINIYTLDIEADPSNIYRHNIKMGLGIFNIEQS